MRLGTLRKVLLTSSILATYLGVPTGRDAEAALPSNPVSTLTLPNSTSARSAGTLIANSATAAQVVPSQFSIQDTGTNAIIPRVDLSINDPTSTAWGGVTIYIDLWLVSPTFNNGDGGAFSVKTGSSSHLGTLSCTMSAVQSDGVYAECAPLVNNLISNLPVNVPIFWTAQANTASGVTAGTKTLTLRVELLQ